MLLALVGGGIYLWVKRQRKLLLQKKMDLAESSKTLDTGGASVLDSVGSPVSSSTTSSASDRPQINAPASGGTNDGTDDGKNSEAVVDPAVDSKFGARFRQAAPTIKELATKLMFAWNEASVAKTAADNVYRTIERERSTVYMGLNCRFINNGDHRAFITEGNAHHSGVIVNVKNWYGFTKIVPSSALAASAAFEALRLALKPFHKDNVDHLPDDLQVLCLSAHSVLEVSKDSIERLLKEANSIETKVEKEELEGRPLKRAVIERLVESDEATFAEGTHQDDIDEVKEARAALTEAMLEAISVHRATDKRFDEARSIFDKLKSLSERTFVFPKKPTPEEILRYLTELEDWAKEKLAAERQVESLMNGSRNGLKDLGDAIKALKRSRGRNSPVLHDAKRVVDEGLLLVVDRMVTDLEAAVSQYTHDQLENGKKVPTVTPQVLTPTSAEEEQIKLFRGLERTFAYALAQQTVATAKLALTQQAEPYGTAHPPRVERSDAFDKYLAQNEAYFAKHAVESAAHDKWAEGRDLVQMALEARKAKVAEATKALSSKLTEAQKASPSKPADELLVVLGVASKMVQVIGS